MVPIVFCRLLTLIRSSSSLACHSSTLIMSMRKRGVKVVWYWQKCWCWPALSLTLVSTSSSVLPCHEPEQIVHLTRCKQATPTELNCELLSTKKSKPTFSSISWPFPSSSESFLSDSLRFALAFEYFLITTFVITFNHYVIINTIRTQFCHHFSFLFVWLLGILCFCRSNISPACRAHGENTLSTCSVWTTTPNTSVEKLITFFENLTS